MKNIDRWNPSKFVFRNGKLRGSRSPAELQIASRLVADIVALHYQKYLKLYASGNLIDLGCGKVPLYGVYKDYVETNVCVDWEHTLNKNPFIDYHCDLNQPLPFDDEVFDTVLLSDVLEHIAEPTKLWQEMERILKPGGKLILNVPFFYKIHEMPHDYYRYTEFALRRFAENCNMKVLFLKPLGGVPEIIADLMAKTTVNLPLAGKPLAIMIQQLCAIFIKTMAGRKLSEKTASAYPLGYFMAVEKNRKPVILGQSADASQPREANSTALMQMLLKKIDLCRLSIIFHGIRAWLWLIC
jgi:SAM-dependent methyltransferase